MNTIPSLRRLLLLLIVCAITNAGASDFYIDPLLGDDQSSGHESAPWASFAQAWQVLQPGDTLILADGRYEEALNIPLSGETGKPVTIKALNDGAALIATAGVAAINIWNQSHLVIEGISAETTGKAAAVVVGGHDGPDWSDRTSDIQLRRIGARANNIDGSGGVLVVARAVDILLEDIWVHGNARSSLGVYGSENVTVRRAVVRWDGWRGLNYNPSNTRTAFGVSNTVDSIFENILVFDGGTPGFGELPETSGPLYALKLTGTTPYVYSPFKGSHNNVFRGIVIVNNTSVGLQVEGGTQLENNRFSHIVSWGNTSWGINVARKSTATHLDHLTVGGNSNGVRFARYWDKVYDASLLDSIVQNNNSVASGKSSIGLRGDGQETSNNFNYIAGHDIDYLKVVPGPDAMVDDPQLAYLFRLEADSPISGQASNGDNPGAEIIYRSINGVNSSTSLWPYPNEDRIKAEMCQVDALTAAGRVGEATPDWCLGEGSLSAYLWEQLGNGCPSGFCDGSGNPDAPGDPDDPEVPDTPDEPGHTGNYYLSSVAGNDSNDGSADQPWRTFSRAWQTLVAGDILVLKSGVYQESLEPSVSGEAGNPIVILAEHDGEAIIETVDQPAIHIRNQNYLTVEGLVARSTGDVSAVAITGHDGPDWSDRTTGIIMRKVGARSGSLHRNSSGFAVARANQVLLEDVWVFGYARNSMAIYGSENVTVRRAVIRWDGWWGDEYKPNDPRVGLTVYNSRNNLFENVIVLDGGEQGEDTQGERVALALAGNHNGETAPFDDSSNNRFYGVILLNNVGSGVNTESGGDTLLNNQFEHLVSWDNGRTGFNVNQNADGTSLVHGTIGMNNTGVRFNNYSGVINNVLYNNLVMSNRKAELVGSESFGIIGGAGARSDNDYNNVFDHQSDYRKYAMTPGANSFSTPLVLEYLLEIPAASVNHGAADDGGDIGATIVKRTVNGRVSSDSLWPYPYEQRIKEEMCDPQALDAFERRGDNTAAWCESEESLSEYIWQYLGSSCPQGYCSN
ncbi:MAG: hypothetical protein JKX92_04380 [Porticoccaceae bacterium]|nr:hypothetical protein [Porticoccaceae bacterium]